MDVETRHADTTFSVCSFGQLPYAQSEAPAIQRLGGDRLAMASLPARYVRTLRNIPYMLWQTFYPYSIRA